MVSDLVRILTPHLFADKRAVDDAVYGTVSVMAVIAGAAHKETSAAWVLVFAGVSTVVIWALHVYADTVAHLGPHAMDWREALRRGLTNDIGRLS